VTPTTATESVSVARRQAIQAYLNDVAAMLLRARRDDLFSTLKGAAEAPRPATPTVVVVGETGRGKSSLINALLGRRLSPVGVDVTTACAIVFHHSDDLVVSIRRAATAPSDGPPAEEVVEIPLDELAEWATVDGNPGNERGLLSVRVGCDSPFLEHLTVVDTPGVGGLDSGHGAYAAEAAAGADALVLVLDPNAPMSGPELEFLASVADRVDNITIVLTKTDTHPGWQVIADDDLKKIEQRVPRLSGLQIFPVSALRSQKTGDRAKWGVAQLESHLLGEVSERTETLRSANILRVADNCVGEAGRPLAQRLTVLRGGPEAMAALQAERQRLESLQSDARILMRELEDELRRLSLDRGDALNRGMRDIRLGYDEKAAVARGDAIDALPGQLLAEVTALADRLTEEARERLTTVAEDLIRRIDGVTPELASLELLHSSDLADTVTLDTPRKKAANRVERLSTVMSFTSGRSIGSFAATLPLVALGGLPFALAGMGVGAFFAFHMHKGRGDTVRQNEFRNWMREQTAEAERQLNNDFSRAMIDVGHELRGLLTERIDTRRRQVAETVKACEGELAREQSVRDAEAQDLERHLGEVGQMQERGRALRTATVAPAAVARRES
jgi:predicted GTPase